MKVILDTNVLVSARIGKVGKPAQILKAILQAKPVIEMLTVEE